MSSTLTKSELIELISNKIKLPKGKAEQLVNCIFDSMVDALKRNEGIEIRGFGSFTVREYKQYEGRNPRTGSPVHVAPKRLPFFKVGKELRERVNNSRPGVKNGSESGVSSATGASGLGGGSGIGGSGSGSGSGIGGSGNGGPSNGRP